MPSSPQLLNRFSPPENGVLSNADNSNSGMLISSLAQKITHPLHTELTKVYDASLKKKQPTVEDNRDVSVATSNTSNEFETQLNAHIALLLQEHPLDERNTELVINAILKAFKSLTDSTYVDMKYMNASAKDELLNAIKIASSLMLNPHYHLTLCAIFGGTQDTCRLRTIAYALAPLEALDKLLALKADLHERGHHTGSVSMKLMSTHHAAILINDYEPSIEKNANSIFSAIKKYITLTRPHLTNTNTIEFLFDSLDEEREFLNHSFAFAAKAIPPQITEQLRAMGQNHGGDTGANNSEKYGILHPFVSGDFARYSEHNSLSSLHSSGVITYGGSPEKRFNKLRKAVTDSLLQNHPGRFQAVNDVARLISIAGERATYYKADNTDLSLIDAVAPETIEPKYSKFIKKDIALIKNDLGLKVAEHIGLFKLEHAEQNSPTPLYDKTTLLKNRLNNSLNRILATPEKWHRFINELKNDYHNANHDNANHDNGVFHNTNTAVLDALSNSRCKKVDQVQTTIESYLFPLLKSLLMEPSPRITAKSHSLS